MRRLHLDHEGVIPDDSVLALWKCDEVSATSGLIDSSYSAAFQLVTAGTSVLYNALFTGSIGVGARGGGSSGAVGWFQSASAASAHRYFSSFASTASAGWSLSLWYRDTIATGTATLVEYSTNETAGSSLDLSPLGVHRLASGALRLQWDLSTTSLAHTLDIAGALPLSANKQYHLGVGVLPNPNSSGFVDVTAVVNNVVVAATQMIRNIGGGGTNGRFVIGASRRWGTGTGASPAFTTTTSAPFAIDDIAIWKVGLKQQKLSEIYANGSRSWSERRMVDGNHQKSICRVLIQDGNSPSNMIDLTALYGINWVKSADINEDVADSVNKASFKLMRFRGNSLNLSPLSQTSVLNQDANAAFAAMIELRRQVRIEEALVPSEWNVQGYEWATVFDGFIDKIAWETDYVGVDCIDRMAPLSDQFQLDPVPYDYYASPTLAETHIQNVIINNVPCVVTGVSLAATNLIFGYKGGTPTLYTPASSGWVLNYDDTPSGPVDSMLQSIADQIGWDCRYKWYDPWQDYRLTFFAPPRLLTGAIEKISKDAASTFALITFQQPHGLSEEQSITIGGTTNYNSTVKVGQVISYHQILTDTAVAGSPAQETSGSVLWGSCYTFNDSQVMSFQEIAKDVSAIRNVAVVKYKRDMTSVTLPVQTATCAINQAIRITLTGSAAFTLSQMNVGDPFTISDSTDANANGSFTIAAFETANRIRSNELLASAVGANTGAFTSDVLTRKMVVSANTISIGKYGLRQAAVYEASSGNIDTEQEANALSNAIVNDLADPTAILTMRIPSAPWLELHDIVTLNPDLKQRWTVAQKMAVTSIHHHFETGQGWTEVGLRNAAPTLGTSWVKRVSVDKWKPGISDALKSEILPITFGPKTNTKMGHAFAMGQRPRTQWGNGGRRRLKLDSMEVHLSTTTLGFIPSAASTLAAEVRGNESIVHHDVGGNPLTPGTTYYAIFRHKDIYGNVGAYSGATSMVARFTDQPSSAKVYCLGGSSVQFRLGGWCPFPFTDTSTSPAFDTFNNFSTVGSSHTAAYCTPPGSSVATGGYFQMPCDGTCEVEARVGVRNSGALKPDTAVAFGIMRIGSSIPGSNASQPLFAKYYGPSEATPQFNTNTPLLVGTSISSLFVTIAGRVTAHSGDYLQIGVLCDWTITGVGTSTGVAGIYQVLAGIGATGSVSASWAKFTVVAQD